jgi:hypothetical protein
MPDKLGRLIALTKRIDAYVKEVPLAWEVYVKEKSKGTEQEKAESVAMRSVYPGDNNTGVRLKTWKKHKFWPDAATAEIRESWESFQTSLSEGMGQDKAELDAVKIVLKDYPHPTEALKIWKRCGVWSAESVRHTEEYLEEPSKSKARPSVSEAASRMTEKDRRTQDNPRTPKDIPDMSQADSGTTREEIMAQLRALLAEIPVEERKWFGKATGKAPEEDKFLQIGAKLPPEVVLEIRSLPGRIAHHLERALKLYLMVLMSAER